MGVDTVMVVLPRRAEQANAGQPVTLFLLLLCLLPANTSSKVMSDQMRTLARRALTLKTLQTSRQCMARHRGCNHACGRRPRTLCPRRACASMSLWKACASMSLWRCPRKMRASHSALPCCHWLSQSCLLPCTRRLTHCAQLSRPQRGSVDEGWTISEYYAGQSADRIGCRRRA